MSFLTGGPLNWNAGFGVCLSYKPRELKKSSEAFWIDGGLVVVGNLNVFSFGFGLKLNGYYLRVNIGGFCMGDLI